MNKEEMTVVPFIDKTGIPGTPAEALRLELSNCNWPEEFPYFPEVTASLWHNGKELMLDFEVEEDYVAALAEKDNDKVAKDSCVEFFISLDNESYYNFEANCAGKILLSNRKGRKIDVKYADNDTLASIKRESSLGIEPFECRKNEGKWRLRLGIPATAFFCDNITSFRRLKARCNLYKCGDDLPEPHYLSWQPVETENPDFHRPEFFAPIEFE